MDMAERLKLVSELIERRVNLDHQNRTSWNKITGQWLVYGFETKIGFLNAAHLEAAVERAYRNKTSITEAAFKALCEIYNLKMEQVS